MDARAAILSAGLIGVVVVATLGLYYLPEGFFGNLLAEAIGVVFGAMATLVVVEGIRGRERREQWKDVEVSTYQSLAVAFHEIAVLAWVRFGIGRVPSPDAPNVPSPQVIEAFDAQIEKLRDGQLPSGSSKSPSQRGVEFYEASKEELGRIERVYLPRLVEFSEDQEFIDTLTNIVLEADKLRSQVKAERTSMVGGVEKKSKDLLVAVRDAYRLLVTRWGDLDLSDERREEAKIWFREEE